MKKITISALILITFVITLSSCKSRHHHCAGMYSNVDKIQTNN